ncbi:hydroxyisourate hydrolase [Pseudenhygromyxa sp. WMMC2535]|uniref:hydroxyisourate hydrolase n=1 Tax=Pseudenhygromyxa sp. WMMC2535 TaxID=2712867 RepID=UPI001552BCBF|nr:hydroxyisourate hydrolase [Pseudenhygromyxa sp. WMMC2535]NVB40073.1 hydroxyisourate hydrolase [Pseudenhygromyxa sp. WMMC2535]
MNDSRSPITTHILDTARGCPATGVSVTLWRQDRPEHWEMLGRGKTDEDGRLSGLISSGSMRPGIYRIHFDTAEYFGDAPSFYPWAEIVFQVEDTDQHYHVPLLLSPFGYSTYRGS